ncbi:MAG: RCC1 domain-containing protein [Streptosporangiaceae bacterium]
MKTRRLSRRLAKFASCAALAFGLAGAVTTSGTAAAAVAGPGRAGAAATFRAWAWGAGNSGELGNGSTASSLVPEQVPILPGITQVAAGSGFSLALASDGTVWAWGFNSEGQLGDNSTTTSYEPVQVAGLTGVTQIAAGTAFGLARRSDGMVWAWGADYDGQLGNAATYAAQTRPVETVGMDSGITQLAAGVNHVLALRSDGTVLAWGDDGAAARLIRAR